jgi:RimJ/RimL family protein N-acetyltransferase
MLETERLILRKWDLDKDLVDFVGLNQDPRVMEFMPSCLTEEESKNLILKANNHIEQHGFGLLACIKKDNQKLIGFVGLNIPTFESHFTPCVEIGWRLAFEAWGKGYATEAAKEVMKAGFEHYGLTEIVSFTTEKNLRSRHVMEKLGMSYNPKDNFYHPKIPYDHPLSKHVLYRKNFFINQ